MIELGQQDFVHRGLAGVWRARQDKKERVVTKSSESAGLNGGYSDFFVGDHAKKLSKTGDGFGDERFDGLGGLIAGREAGASRGDHDADLRILDPGPQFFLNLRWIIFDDASIHDAMPGLDKFFNEYGSRTIFASRAAVGDG